MKFKFTFFLALAWCSWAWGQANAGPDVLICPGSSVSIGTSGFGTFCYHWEPATGLSDPQSPTPAASPAQTTTYTLTVISEDFSNRWTDQVTVTVDQIQSFSVTPKKCCWAKDDVLQVGDFDIMTTPAGAQTMITFDPPKAEFPSTYLGQANTYVQEVVVKLTCGQAVLEQKVNITVVDENAEFSPSFSTGFQNIGDIVEGACKFADDLGGILNYVTLATAGICAPSADCTFSLPTQGLSFSKKCCGDDPSSCIKDKAKISLVSGGISAGLACYVPFAGVPGGATLNVTVEATVSAGASLGLGVGNECDSGNLDACITFPLVGTIGGGVSSCVGPCGAGIIQVDGLLVGGITFDNDFGICFPNSQVTVPTAACIFADLVARFEFASGVVSVGVPVPVVPKKCF
ncbi:MAG: hypothetical protein RI973_216 [Bacteroidota bacterium]|jgi:hypothetical protein